MQLFIVRRPLPFLGGGLSSSLPSSSSSSSSSSLPPPPALSLNETAVYGCSPRPSRCLAKYEIHIFVISSSSFPGYITNQYNDHLPVSLLAQLVRALHRYHGARSGFEKAQQAKISFCNSISWVSNCDDLLYIY